jgi:hypothetical protein
MTDRSVHHRRWRLHVGLVTSALAVAVTQQPASLSAVPSQDVGPDVRVTSIGPPPPVGSLRNLWLRSPVIIVGRVVRSSEPRVVGSTVSRVQSLVVSEVVKGGDLLLSASSSVDVVIFGGTATVNGVEYRTNYPVPPMATGEEALLFLTPHGSEYAVSAGDYGLFRAKGNANREVVLNERQARMTDMRGRGRTTLDDLVAELRGIR